MSRSKSLYRQCRLERPSPEGGTITTTTWLPEEHKGATLEPGVRLTLKDHVTGKVGEDLWEVKSVSTQTQTAEQAHKRAHDWANYRAQTDV